MGGIWIFSGTAHYDLYLIYSRSHKHKQHTKIVLKQEFKDHSDEQRPTKIQYKFQDTIQISC